MPKESKTPISVYTSSAAPYPTPSSAGPRNTAIWSTADDETLLHARASGLNWQPIANRHFPNKTANACRKRHERLIERRHVEDWDVQKLEILAQEYVAVRKEMWEVLASRVGERWAVVEAKVSETLEPCMGEHSLTKVSVYGERSQEPTSGSAHSAEKGRSWP